VAGAYAGLPAMLVAAAKENVLAHLRKLEAEGVAEARGEGWILVRLPSN